MLSIRYCTRTRAKADVKREKRDMKSNILECTEVAESADFVQSGQTNATKQVPQIKLKDQTRP